MKITITEKQLELILSKESEIEEQGDAATTPEAGTDPSAAQPTAGTSTTGQKQGYPEVGKWESGVTRGPANQIGVTKWSDVVGSSLKRDKGNQLKEQEEEPKGYANVRNSYKIEGQETILTPKGYATYVPTGTKILQTADQEYYLELLTSNSLKNWISKEKGGFGNKETEQWIPTLDIWPKIVKNDSVTSFKLPTGIVYNAMYTNPILDKITSWDEFYKLDPKPETWNFIGYFDNNNQQYRPVNAPSQNDFLNWLSDNWEIIAQVAASIIVGVLTAGSSLLLQAIAQLGVDLVFAMKQLLIDKDSIGAGISIIMGLVPVVGRLGKYGVKDVNIFLKKWGQTLSKVKTSSDFKLLWKQLDYNEQLLLTRALKQTPAELKKSVNLAFVKAFEKSIKNKSIQLTKIPLKKLLWMKQVFVEGGISLTMGVGLSIANAIYQRQEMIKKYGNEIEQKIINDELKLSLDSDSKNELDSLAKELGVNLN